EDAGESPARHRTGARAALGAAPQGPQILRGPADPDRRREIHTPRSGVHTRDGRGLCRWVLLARLPNPPDPPEGERCLLDTQARRERRTGPSHHNGPRRSWLASSAGLGARSTTRRSGRGGTRPPWGDRVCGPRAPSYAASSAVAAVRWRRGPI